MEEGWIRGKKRSSQCRQWWFRRNNGTRGDNGWKRRGRPSTQFPVLPQTHPFCPDAPPPTHPLSTPCPKACHCTRVPDRLTPRRMAVRTGFCTPHTPRRALSRRLICKPISRATLQKVEIISRVYINPVHLRRRLPSETVMNWLRLFFGSWPSWISRMNRSVRPIWSINDLPSFDSV